MSAGIDRKKLSRVAATRSRPRTSPAEMVAPERETPGISARHCTAPMTSASRSVSSFSPRSWVA